MNGVLGVAADSAERMEGRCCHCTEALHGPSAAGQTPNATHYRSDTPTPTYGPTQPVQPTPPAVPQWATGLAVASVGIGRGSLGLGAAAWLVLDGLSAVTLTGLLTILAPFAGAAVLALAIGRSAAKTRAAAPAPVTRIYKGTVHHRTEINATSQIRGLLSRGGTTNITG